MKITRFSMVPTLHGHASFAMACSAALDSGFIVQSVIGRNNPYDRPTPYANSLRPLLIEARSASNTQDELDAAMDEIDRVQQQQ